jgi:hypothetical protein
MIWANFGTAPLTRHHLASMTAIGVLLEDILAA